jgi:hypothetical protein
MSDLYDSESDRDRDLSPANWQAHDQTAQLQINPAAILARIPHLSQPDQNLLTLALSGRHSFRAIAILVNSNPGSVCRRVRLLIRKLSDPIVIALLERPMSLSEKYQRIGLARFLFQRGIRSIAREFDLSEKEICIIITHLRRWTRLTRDEPVPKPRRSRRATRATVEGGV